MTKIMLVEDDNNLREIYEARLAAEGYDIVSAGDGEAALALAGKERPDMIISDVMMPKISGFEMLDILRNTDNLRDVKIIMLTALGQAEDAERANHLGADRYLVKSQVTLEDIVDTTHELLNDKEAESPAQDLASLPSAPAAAIDMPATDDAVAALPTDVTAQEPPVAMAMPAAPAPAPVVPEAAPDVSVAPEPAMSVPVTEPVEDSAPAATASTAISIPVTEDTSSDDAASPATDDTTTDTNPTDIAVSQEPTPAPEPSVSEPELHPVSNLPVTPDTPESSDSAQPADQSDQAPIDYTSPENFMKFQASPVIPEITSPVVDTNFTPSAPEATPAADSPAPPAQEEAPQASSLGPDAQLSSSQEEDAVKAKIDAFISQQDTEDPSTAPAPETPSAPVAEDSQPDVAEPPVVSDQEPSAASQPTAMTDPFAATRSKPSYATDEPVPEELGAFSDPTIQSGPAATPAAADDALVAAALQDLEQGAAADNGPSETNYGADSASKVITPDTTEKPDIDRLLELEAAKSSAQQAASATAAPKPHVDNLMPTAMPGNVVPAPPQDDAEDPDKVAL